eukprot:410118_1
MPSAERNSQNSSNNSQNRSNDSQNRNNNSQNHENNQNNQNNQNGRDEKTNGDEKKNNYGDHPKDHKKNTKKKKKRKVKNTETTLSYAPLQTAQVKGYILISRSMTHEIIPNKIARKYTDVYSYLDKMVALQTAKIIKGWIWILDPNFYCNQTGQPLYCITDKIDPDIKGNRGYEWKMRDQLYTAKDVYNLIQNQCNELPSSIITNVLKNEIQQNLNITKSLIVKNMKKIFHTKKPWQHTITFTNEKHVVLLWNKKTTVF